MCFGSQKGVKHCKFGSFLGYWEHSTSVWVPTEKNHFFAPNLLLFCIFLLFSTKMVKMTISTSIWGATNNHISPEWKGSVMRQWSDSFLHWVTLFYSPNTFSLISMQLFITQIQTCYNKSWCCSKFHIGWVDPTFFWNYQDILLLLLFFLMLVLLRRTSFLDTF